MEGYVKLHRRMLDNPVVCKDSDYLAVWVYLILNATHTSMLALFKGEKITLLPGQLLTGRKSISEKLHIDESKVQRILKKFETEQQIEQQTGNKNRLITILNWEKYQTCEQQNAQQMNNNCTTDEQQVNTNKNVKNERMEEDIILSVSQQKKTDVIAFFESIWKLYPVKRGKAAVSFSQQERLYKIGYEPMQRAINRYVQGLEKDASWRKPQNGSTFFNKGYADYLDENYVEPAEQPKQEKPSEPKKNGFHNFEQRDTDYDAMVLNRLRQKLGGGEGG